MDNDKQALVSMNAKADMLGELGTTLTSQDNVMDKDWSHYGAKEGVVMFVDGVDMTSGNWHWERFKQNLPSFTAWRRTSRSRSESFQPPRQRNQPEEYSPKDDDPDSTLLTDIEKPSSRHLSVPFAGIPHALSPGLPESIPIDAGPLHLSMRRSSSVVSSLSSRPTSRSPSLRRET